MEEKLVTKSFKITKKVKDDFEQFLNENNLANNVAFETMFALLEMQNAKNGTSAFQIELVENCTKTILEQFVALANAVEESNVLASQKFSSEIENLKLRCNDMENQKNAFVKQNEGLQQMIKSLTNDKKELELKVDQIKINEQVVMFNQEQAEELKEVKAELKALRLKYDELNDAYRKLLEKNK